MAEHVVGRDPIENIDIWRRDQGRLLVVRHRGGVAAFALSAIDIALWDLKGKLLGRPLINLLGGAHHERLPAIASTHAYRRRASTSKPSATAATCARRATAA